MKIAKIKAIILNIIIYIFLPTLLTYILVKIPHLNNTLFLNFYNLIPPLITLIIMLKMNKDLFQNKFNNFKKNLSKYLPLMFKYYLCGLILMNISSQILVFITGALPANEEANRELLQILPFYSLINSGLFGPICEEIAFRGTFKRLITNKKVYLLITSFIFGFIHVIFNLDFINIFPYMLLGFFLSLTYFETDNIYTTIGIHMFHNILCLLLILV